MNGFFIFIFIIKNVGIWCGAHQSVSPFDGYDDIVRGRFGRWEV